MSELQRSCLSAPTYLTHHEAGRAVGAVYGAVKKMSEMLGARIPLLASLQGGVAAPSRKCRAASLAGRRRGGFRFNWNTTPASRKRMLRDIFLIARPPLLAVMRGGEFAAIQSWFHFCHSPFIETSNIVGGHRRHRPPLQGGSHRDASSMLMPSERRGVAAPTKEMTAEGLLIGRRRGGHSGRNFMS